MTMVLDSFAVRAKAFVTYGGLALQPGAVLHKCFDKRCHKCAATLRSLIRFDW
jgi:hypothetical protein